MDCIDHGVTKSWTRLSDFQFNSIQLNSILRYKEHIKAEKLDKWSKLEIFIQTGRDWESHRAQEKQGSISPASSHILERTSPEGPVLDLTPLQTPGF